MSTIIEDENLRREHLRSKEYAGVSWGAIIAGAVAATSVTLILIILGMGLGFAAVSPWADRGASGETIGVVTIIWITLVSIAASALGGYIAGRLRPRWNRIHTDEVYFRDTAHGFLAWGISTLIMATLLSSTVSSLISGGAKVGAAAVGGAAVTANSVAASTGKSNSDSGTDYVLDKLFRHTKTNSLASEDIGGAQSRSPNKAPGKVSKETRMEAARIFVRSVASDEFPSADKQYLAKVIASETNTTEAEAAKRIQEAHDTLIQAKNDAIEAADKAAKAAAYASLWMFISLLIGAFVASWCATCGGRCRDEACVTTDGRVINHTTTDHRTN